MKRFLGILLFAATLSTPEVAEAKRVALVIANSSYQQIDPLKNPGRDGVLVSTALESAGFTTVLLRPDLDGQAFRKALKGFRDMADGADIAMVYYAGHGVELGGQNYLIPTDAELVLASDLKYDAVDLDLLLTTLAGAKMRVAILDACRTNPFQSKSSTAKLTNGLAKVDVDDVLLIFAAAPGKPAFDGDGDNSPFAKALARHILKPRLPVQMLGGTIRDDVIAETANEQRPFISASITGVPFYLMTEQAELALVKKTAPKRKPGAKAAKPKVIAVAPPAPTPTPPPVAPLGAQEQWVASDKKLSMDEVTVTRELAGDKYLYKVKTRYPETLPTNGPAAQARIIRVLTRSTSKTRSAALNDVQRIKIGTWGPGQPCGITFKIDKALVDSDKNLDVRLCMGDDENCVWSPNLARADSKQRLRAPEVKKTVAFRSLL